MKASVDKGEHGRLGKTLAKQRGMFTSRKMLKIDAGSLDVRGGAIYDLRKSRGNLSEERRRQLQRTKKTKEKVVIQGIKVDQSGLLSWRS